MSASRERWIRIGSVNLNVALVTRRGYRQRGCWINWRGRTDWCQPNEFESFEVLAAAVKTRLKMARLEPVALASRPPQKEYQPLWVLVRRKKHYGNVGTSENL